MTAPVPATDARPLTARSVNTRVVGGMLLVFGSGWLLQQTGVALPWTAIVSLVLVSLGLAMIITSRSRATSVPLILVGAALTVGLAIGASDIRFRGGIGERTFNPPSITRDARFDHFIGDVTIDLRHTDFTKDNARFRGEVTFGKMVVRLPAGVGFDVDVDVQWGEATVFGERHEFKRGRAPAAHVRSSNYDTADQQVHLKLRSFAGEIQVYQDADSG
jgi:predicted membrane protein